MIKIPEMITLEDGTEIHLREQPAMAKLLTKMIKDSASESAKTEKDKLYPTIEEYRKQISGLMTKIDGLGTPGKNINTPPVVPAPVATEIPAVITSDTINTPTDTPLSQEQMRAMAQDVKGLSPDQMKALLKDVFSENLSVAMKDVMGPIQESLQKITAERLDEYRAKILVENDGKLIPEMVKGTSKEEIDASVLEATTLYGKYVKPEAASQVPPVVVPPVQTPAALGQQPAVQVPAATPVSVEMPGAVVPTVVAIPLGDVKNMTDEEFAKNRDMLQKKLITQNS